MALLFKLTQKFGGFLGFYSRYPRKEAKVDGEKAWHQKVKTEETEALIHAALDWQIPIWDEREKKFIPLPASYLRGERWTDEPPTPPKTTSRITVNDPWDQQKRTQEAMRLMREEGLSREEAMRRAFQ